LSYHLYSVILLRYSADFLSVICLGKAGRQTMGQQTQRTVSRIVCLRTWGASVRLDVLLCLCALAIQLFIPAAQVWHIATEHIPAAPLQLQSHSGQFSPLAFRTNPDIPHGHESYDLAECLMCQAFVRTSDAVETPFRLSIDLATYHDVLFLRGPPLRQTFLTASSPRAPPVFS